MATRGVMAAEKMPTWAQWEEIQRLAMEAAQTRASGAVVDLLAALGVVHNTPAAKREWLGW